MSLLDDLLTAHALDSQLLPIDLAAYHVPFVEVGRQDVEKELASGAEATHRIGLIAPTGAGKTSASRFALEHLSAVAAPIWVTINTDTRDVILDTKRFLAHLGQTILLQRDSIERLTQDEHDKILEAVTARRPLPAETKKRGARLGARWMLTGELSEELGKTLTPESLDKPVAELRAVLFDVLDLLAAHQRRPVVVIDDSDSFTAFGNDRDPLIRTFFGRVLRELAQLPAGLVVSIQDTYMDNDAFRDANDGFIDHMISVPEIVSGHLRVILDRRIQFVSDHATSGDVFDEPALEMLFALHRSGKRNLRRTLAIAQQSVVEAMQASPIVTDDHVLRGAQQLGHV